MQPIGAHVADDDPIARTTAIGGDAVQFFLTDPQAWLAPPVRDDTAQLVAAGESTRIFIHAPYRINVATTNNRIRVPSRKLLSQHAAAAAAIGASGLIVHGGHVGDGDDAAKGFENWRKLFERESFPVPILIENTAGGENAMARSLEQIKQLWDAVGEFGAGLCLDTCHAHAAGLPLENVVHELMAITGRIDLVHANGSRDEFGSARDRHANFSESLLDPALVVAVVKESGAPAIVETHPDGQADDIAVLRAGLA